MPEEVQVSDAEWEVIAVLWDRAPLTAGEIVAAVSRSRDWHPRTIKTLLSRLVRKGAVLVSVEGKRYLYRPRLSRHAAVRRESRSFLQRVFGGSAAPAIAHLLSTTRLSARELAELRRIIDREARP